MLLDKTISDVLAQLNDQKKNGVRIQKEVHVPEEGPTDKGLWFKIPNVTAVFVDLKSSTKLVTNNSPDVAAEVYTYFVRAMTIIFNRFSVRYVDIQGDGLFGLFSGSESIFSAIACAITMNTAIQEQLPMFINSGDIKEWVLHAGIGVDRETVLVRRLGLKGERQNEVWAGKPVNMAAKLSSRASFNQILVSDRVYNLFKGSSDHRRHALLQSCSCKESSKRKPVWVREKKEPAKKRGFDFKVIYRSNMKWCPIHGDDFCEAIVNGKRPRQ